MARSACKGISANTFRWRGRRLTASSLNWPGEQEASSREKENRKEVLFPFTELTSSFCAPASQADRNAKRLFNTFALHHVRISGCVRDAQRALCLR